jgi:hypothetical protein
VPLFSTPVPVRSISPWSVTGAAGDDGLAQRQLAGAVDGDGAAGHWRSRSASQRADFS